MDTLYAKIDRKDRATQSGSAEETEIKIVPNNNNKSSPMTSFAADRCDRSVTRPQSQRIS